MKKTRRYLVWVVIAAVAIAWLAPEAAHTA